jgi:DNA-binding HxlR family transcriptional regulator
MSEEPILPSMARVYAALLGEPAAYAADRAAVDRVANAEPLVFACAREGREFTCRAVAWAAQQDITQFLDLGAGPPLTLSPNLHEIIAARQPAARIIYADIDAWVTGALTDATAGLENVAVITADAGNPARTLSAAAAVGYDPGKPVCLILSLVLHFYPPQHAGLIVAGYARLVAPGSYIVVAIGRADGPAATAMPQAYTANRTYNASREEVAEWLRGLEIVSPGLADARAWRPGALAPGFTPRGAEIWCGVARTPQTAGVQEDQRGDPEETTTAPPRGGWEYLDELLDLIAGQWPRIVLRHVPAESPGARPSQLLAGINAVVAGRLQQKRLHECLAALVARGLVTRQARSKATYYQLTDRGSAVLAALRQVAIAATEPRRGSGTAGVPQFRNGPGRNGVASMTRVADAWLGGKDNYAADREAARDVSQMLPVAAATVAARQDFHRRAVRWGSQEGLRQFLDIGTGIPAPGGTDPVSSSAVAGSRVLWVGNDPVALMHARATLDSAGDVAGDVAIEVGDADPGDPGAILAVAASLLDLRQPVMLILGRILLHIPDEEDPWAYTQALTQALAPGSAVIVSNPASDTSRAGPSAMNLLNQRLSSPVTFRSCAQVARFTEGLTVVSPGVVSYPHWRPDPGTDVSVPAAGWGAVAWIP